ncbi:hypothetical protein ACWEOE_23235 [Amycolatopsis sp. NPDC004368]
MIIEAYGGTMQGTRVTYCTVNFQGTRVTLSAHRRPPAPGARG